MPEALINGERDPEVLAGRARGTLRSNIPELVDAPTGASMATITKLTNLGVAEPVRQVMRSSNEVRKRERQRGVQRPRKKFTVTGQPG